MRIWTQKSNSRSLFYLLFWIFSIKERSHFLGSNLHLLVGEEKGQDRKDGDSSFTGRHLQAAVSTGHYLFGGENITSDRKPSRTKSAIGHNLYILIKHKVLKNLVCSLFFLRILQKMDLILFGNKLNWPCWPRFVFA